VLVIHYMRLFWIPKCGVCTIAYIWESDVGVLFVPLTEKSNQ